MTLEEKLKTVLTLDELYGFANRRKVLCTDNDELAPKWTAEERAMIMQRKYEIEQGKL